MSDRADQLVHRAAKRTKLRPTYLGHVLQEYMDLEDLTWTEVQQGLGDVPFEQLALCLRPRTAHFSDDVAEIGAKFRADPVFLARIVRTVDAVRAFRSTATETGTMLAARTRPPDRE